MVIIKLDYANFYDRYGNKRRKQNGQVSENL